MWTAERLINEAEAINTDETSLIGYSFIVMMHKVGVILRNPAFRLQKRNRGCRKRGKRCPRI